MIHSIEKNYGGYAIIIYIEKSLSITFIAINILK